jgi:hypothetical protein
MQLVRPERVDGDGGDGYFERGGGGEDSQFVIQVFWILFGSK